MIIHLLRLLNIFEIFLDLRLLNMVLKTIFLVITIEDFKKRKRKKDLLVKMETKQE